MQNANLTTEQDLGAVTELLSGAFYSPFGRSTSHQMWSSAMVLTPALRGMFGVSVDGVNGIVTVDPHLPAQWPAATLRNLQIGGASVDLRFERHGDVLSVAQSSKRDAASIKLASTVRGATTSSDGKLLTLPLPAVEIGSLLDAANSLPLPGSQTTALKVLEQQFQPHRLTLLLEAQGGSTQNFLLESTMEKPESPPKEQRSSAPRWRFISLRPADISSKESRFIGRRF